MKVLVVEAIRMIERGDATAEDIDTAMELGAGYRELISSFWGGCFWTISVADA